ncbi:MAG: hypothetical protein PVG14_00595 [Anaerolineales bacterium]
MAENAFNGTARSIGPWPSRTEDIPSGDRRRPWIHVTLQGPDDGGDFGPNTPGTHTSGLQEALDYAHENHRDVFVHGGRGGMHDGVISTDNIYILHETLHIPWSQDFCLYGGNAIWAYREETGDAIIIDSQMNCRYKLGLIVSESDGAAVRIRPHSPGPDDFTLITASVFDFSAVVSKHPRGAGIVLDSTEGPILHSRIFAEEANTRGRGVYLTGVGLVEDNKARPVPSYRSSPKSISCNEIVVMYNQQQHASGKCTNLWIGDPGADYIRYNHFYMHLYAPRGSYFDEKVRRWTLPEEYAPHEEAVGARIFGQDNVLSLSFHNKRSRGNDLIFETDARDNIVHVFNLPNGVTNRARVPTNRIIPNSLLGFDLTTPPVPPSGSKTTNVTSSPVEVYILKPGRVSEWSIGDPHGNDQAFSAELMLGQTFRLEPGERIGFIYSEAPAWRWKAST